MKHKPMKVKLEFTEELLGTTSANPDLVREFIASKGPNVKTADEEVEAIPDVDGEVQKSTTVFPRDADGQPILWDYQIKGFFKDACSMLRRVSDTPSAKLTSHRKHIDGLIFVNPRQVKLQIPDGKELSFCERPLRAQTPKGERVALARSEAAPAGTKITFEIDILKDSLLRVIEEWLDYGKLRGLGQWRNSGKGRFKWTEVEK